jgi:hypothetical protein
MESALRPRDIQARIRAGESPEDVAAAAQTSVDSIMGFATPVLAERAHVARTAQKASVRRRAEGAGTARTLGESAGLFFADHSLHDEDVSWDAWRQADGRWALVAEYAVGGRDRRAEFSHDLPGRYVVAENDEARILTGELRDPGTPGSVPPRRLSAVSSSPSQDELPLGDDAIELVRDRATEAEEPEVAEIAEEAAAEETVEVPADEPLVEDEPAASADVVAEEAEALEVEEPELDEPAAEEPPAAKPKPKKKGRSSIPSWDEIMFGGNSD